ncbi:uncharacterized protein TRUGW13939_09733 [Talaromyces rugulosus]|uniref:FAD-binding FR-type domain-containing protein n=1 Tax=Talaromyces rugulosus TaxID=121627 RepID=A0A7H8R858_TALRU|nr:uncharacterized protein TRUGW13939_09733 [Talaromyces rugulosus]QKX62572.1 hypothetical protein TRUGW13939_09733 [Talaromyces rugulosus]
MLINLIPLSLGGRVNWICWLLNIDPCQLRRIHQWIGFIAAVEGTAHVILSVFQNIDQLRETVSAADILTGSSLALILMSLFPLFRKKSYESFSIIHVTGSVLLVGTLWHHVIGSSPFQKPRVYLLIVTSIWLVDQILRLGCLLYRSLPHRGVGNKATLVAFPDTTHICVKLSAPWNFRPGQYVYLTIPRASKTALIQSHPFYIAWWYESLGDHNDEKPKVHKPDTIVLLSATKNGFTKELTRVSQQNLLMNTRKALKEKQMPDPCWCATLDKTCQIPAVIEGPFGHEVNLDTFETVLFFTSGIGIAAQLLYMKHLAEVKEKDGSKRVALFWELQSEYHAFWVNSWMTEILSIDSSKKLIYVHIYVLGDYVSEDTQVGNKASATKGSTHRIYDHLSKDNGESWSVYDLGFDE